MKLIEEKVTQAEGLLKEFDIDCWITFVRESQINGDPILDFIVGTPVTWHSAFIFSSSGEKIAIVGQYDRQTVEDLGVYDEVIGFVEGITDPFVKTIQRLNPREIAVNYSVGSEIADGITHGMYLTLVDLFTKAGWENEIISAEPIISALRQRKTTSELGSIREAAAQAEAIFDSVAGFIKPGRTEIQIARFMQALVRQNGLEFAWDEAVCPSVFTGPDTAGAHYTPTDRLVEPGHLLSMDFGVKVDGYCSDLQRTFYVLRPGESEAPPEVQRGFNVIVSAIEAARQKIMPDEQGWVVDEVARDIITDAGYAEFPAGLGHQVGRFSHDGTALLGPKWEKYADKPIQKLEPGMVFTIEPRLEVPGHGIVTIEEMVVIQENGAEWLSTPQTELRLIGS